MQRAAIALEELGISYRRVDIDLIEQMLERNFVDDYPRINRWRRLLAERGSVTRAVRKDYPTALLEFIGKRDSWLGERARQLLARQFAA